MDCDVSVRSVCGVREGEKVVYSLVASREAMNIELSFESCSVFTSPGLRARAFPTSTRVRREERGDKGDNGGVGVTRIPSS